MANDVIESLKKTLCKQFGPSALFSASDNRVPEKAEAISTGSFKLDKATGIGGLPRGRIVEIYGPGSAGKTTLSLECIASAQKAGLLAAFVDAEHTYDPTYARAIGVDTDTILLSQPDCGEDALEIADSIVRSGKVAIVVIDSVAALVPKAELEGEMNDQQIGLQARLLSKACRKLTGVVSKSNCLVVFLNQTRQKIGVLWGNPEVVAGGMALSFYSSMRLRVSQVGEKQKDANKQVIAATTRVQIVKNKLAIPYKTVEFIVRLGQGIDKEAEISTAIQETLFTKDGTWFLLDGEKIAYGEPKLLSYIAENKEALLERLQNSEVVSTTEEKEEAAD